MDGWSKHNAAFFCGNDEGVGWIGGNRAVWGPGRAGAGEGLLICGETGGFAGVAGLRTERICRMPAKSGGLRHVFVPGSPR